MRASVSGEHVNVCGPGPDSRQIQAVRRTKLSADSGGADEVDGVVVNGVGAIHPMFEIKHVVKRELACGSTKLNDHRRPHRAVGGALVEPDPTLQRRKIVCA